MLTFNYNSEDKVTTLTFSGRMDYLAAVNLTEIIENEPIMINWKPGDRMVFDVGEVDYIASSFIRVCVSYAKQAGPGQFSMINCQPFVKKTFKISGLDDALNIS
jgi:anti-anti-sigma factor